MDTQRIEEIQKETFYPESVSIKQALLKVWNETEQKLQAENKALMEEVETLTAEREQIRRYWNQYTDYLKSKYPAEDGKEWTFSCEHHLIIDGLLKQSDNPKGKDE